MLNRHVVTACGVLVPGIAALGQAAFTPLAPLPSGTGYCIAEGIAPDGSLVVGNSELTTERRAVQWGGAGAPMALPNGAGLSPIGASATSADASVVVGMARADSACPQPFRWTESAGVVGLGVLSPGLPAFAEGSRATDTSADGGVVVGYQRGPDAANFEPAFKAWLWTEAGGMIDLGHLPDSNGVYQVVEATAVSSDGSTVVGFDISIGQSVRAFRWTQASGMVFIGDLSGGLVESYARDVSADGGVVVGSSSSDLGDQAFRWTQAGGMVALGDLPDGEFASDATAVSADGSIVVGRANIVSPQLGGGSHAFIWDGANGMRDLRGLLIEQGAQGLTGWRLDWPTGISADGRVIAGWGINPAGIQQGWVATLSDQPMCAADFNNSGSITVQDIFDFLAAYFAGLPGADFNGAGGITVQDIFDYLAAYFVGCP